MVDFNFSDVLCDSGVKSQMSKINRLLYGFSALCRAVLCYYCCRGFVNRSAIGVGVWRFVEGGEHGGAIRDGGSTSLPSFRSRNGGETLRAAIIHYMATSARLQ
jgi:hypothetical protein